MRRARDYCWIYFGPRGQQLIYLIEGLDGGDRRWRIRRWIGNKRSWSKPSIAYAADFLGVATPEMVERKTGGVLPPEEMKDA